MAASIQVVTEEIVLRLAETVKKETGEENMCLAGGVAFNCVANGKLLRDGPFKNVWIQPAAGDAGGALGAAFSYWHEYKVESFASCVSDYFELASTSPYMLRGHGRRVPS